MSTMYSVGLMNQVGDALENAGYTSADLTLLRSNPKHLRDLKLVLADRAKITVLKHVIDLSADPFEPDGMKVVEHNLGGTFEWDPFQVSFLYSLDQQNGQKIKGFDLRNFLKGYRPLNANVLDYLLEYPELIPHSWNSKTICFWGTIYIRQDGYLVVRTLKLHEWKWHSFCRWIVNVWTDEHPAIVRCGQVTE
jgi:hypothetical protein